ncbi:MAG: thiamine-phosphate kinase [Thermoproteota archaeon]|jgi:thiamine-monophosphate kinase
MKVSDLGERKLIETIHNYISTYWEKPIYDDSVFFKSLSTDFLVLHTNVFNESTDLPPLMDFYSFGWKSTIANLSDVAVKGAKPLGILFSITLPDQFDVEDFKNLIKGICDASKANSIKYLGGDLSSGKELSLAGFCFGFSKNIIPRNKAKEGDLLGVTGRFGITSIAYKIIFNNLEVSKEIKDFFLNKLFKPKGRVKEALAIAPLINSSMDISDGLALSLHQFCKLNGLGAEISYIPIESHVLQICKSHKLDELNLALYEGGEEYEILFSFSKDRIDEIKSILNYYGCDFSIIGKLTRDKKIIYNNGKEAFEIEEKGWEHFKYWKK